MKKLNMEDFFDLDDNDDLENAMREIVTKVNKIITSLEQTDLNIISLGGSVLTLDDANNILFRQLRDRIEKLEGNPVAQQSDNTAKEVLQIAENLYDEFSAAAWLSEENYFQFTAIIDFLRDIVRLEARTTDKVRPINFNNTMTMDDVPDEYPSAIEDVGTKVIKHKGMFFVLKQVYPVDDTV